MAGDWIKVEDETPQKPEVWALAEALDLDPDAAMGKLLRVWIWFDKHTEAGNAPSVTKKMLDREVCVTGFCDALIDVGWMIEGDNEIALPNFDRHNGKTAKSRALTAKRVADKKRRDNAEINAFGNGSSVKSELPREEKRREGDNPPVVPPSGDERSNEQTSDDQSSEPATAERRDKRFDEFWDVYPKRRNKKQALEQWKRKRLDDRADEIIDDVCRRQVADAQWLDGYTPDPNRYLRDERWTDDYRPIQNAKRDPADQSSPKQRAWEYLKREGLV